MVPEIMSRYLSMIWLANNCDFLFLEKSKITEKLYKNADFYIFLGGVTKMICGNCVNWICDDLLLMKGHCVEHRTEGIFHGENHDNCKDYKCKWVYIRPKRSDEE